MIWSGGFMYFKSVVGVGVKGDEILVVVWYY